MNLARLCIGVVAAALTIAVSPVAPAADLSTYREPPPQGFYPPNFTWTGFYVGLNIGGVWGTGSRSTTLYDAGYPLLIHLLSRHPWNRRERMAGAAARGRPRSWRGGVRS